MNYLCILLLYEHSCFSSYVSSVFSRLSRLRASLGLRKQPNSTERACKFGGLAPSRLSGLRASLDLWKRPNSMERERIVVSTNGRSGSIMRRRLVNTSGHQGAHRCGIWLPWASYAVEEQMKLPFRSRRFLKTWRRWSPTSLLFSSIPAERRILQNTFVLNMLLLP